MTHAEWIAEAEKRFGKDPLKWKFVCPSCGHVASVEDWKAAGAPSTAAAFSCVGRWLKVAKDAFTNKGKGPCNYAGGGLFRINPVVVMFPDGTEHQAFAFAEPAEVSQC